MWKTICLFIAIAFIHCEEIGGYEIFEDLSTSFRFNCLKNNLNPPMVALKVADGSGNFLSYFKTNMHLCIGNFREIQVTISPECIFNQNQTKPYDAVKKFVDLIGDFKGDIKMVWLSIFNDDSRCWRNSFTDHRNYVSQLLGNFSSMGFKTGIATAKAAWVGVFGSDFNLLKDLPLYVKMYPDEYFQQFGGWTKYTFFAKYVNRYHELEKLCAMGLRTMKK